MRLYHGTQQEAIGKILEEGLIPHKDFYGEEGIWLSPTIEEALAAGPIVLEVRIPKDRLESRRMYFEGHGYIGTLEYITREPVATSAIRVVRDLDFPDYHKRHAGQLPPNKLPKIFGGTLEA